LIFFNTMAHTESSETLALPVAAWGRLAITAAAHTVEHLYVGIIAVVLPVMATSLGLTMSQAGLLVSARSLVAGLSNIPSGLLADLLNRRSIVLGLCLILLGLSSLLMSFAHDFWVLLAFMALGGVGGGGFHPQSLAILSGAYRDRRALALGVHDSAGNLGEVIGPLTTLQVWALPGLAMGLVYAFCCAETNHAPAPQRATFKRALWENILTNRAVFGMVLISAFRTMGQTTLLAFLPLYLTVDLKLPAGTMGIYVSILFLFAGISPSFSGWLADRFGRKPLIVIGSIVSAIAIAVIPYYASGIPLIIGLAVVGTVLWALRPVILAAAMEAAPPQMAGSIVGFLFTGNMGLSFIGPLVAGFTADLYGLATALAVVGVFPLLAGVVALGPLMKGDS
jgi:MFS transporter, FSR family, fosmidomycin resistance protein